MLLILELSLKKYKRLRLQDVKHFHIKFREVYQLIIGTNGSGKSSIMRELTPMPANHKDYEKGGGKDIVILFNGMLYRLISDFTHGNNHEFHMADASNFNVDEYDLSTIEFTNLNEGRTAKAQKTLVEQHFKVNQEILDVLLGDTKFTAMPALKRRDWILRLAGGDLEYALQVHRKLNNLVNEQIAIVKHTNKRINEEQMKMISEAEYAQLESLVGEYTETLNKLYNVPLIHDLKHSTMYFRAAETKIAQALQYANNFKQINAQRPVWFNIEIQPMTQYTDAYDILKSELESIRFEVRTNKESLNRLYEDANNLNKTLEQLKNAYSGNIDDLINEKDQLHDQYLKDVHMHPFNIGMINDNAEEVAAAWAAIYAQLIGIFNNIEDNSERKYSRAQRDTIQAQMDIIRRDLQQNTRAHEKVLHQLDHIRNAEHMTCPECAHKWVIGIPTNVTPARLEEEGNRIKEMIKYDEYRLTEMSDYIERCGQYNSAMAQFSSIVKSNPVHEKLWDKMNLAEVFFNPPLHSLKTIESYNSDVLASVGFAKRLFDIRSMQDVITQAQAIKGSKAEVSEGLLEETNRRIQEIHTELDDLQIKESELRAWMSSLEQMHQNFNAAMDAVTASFEHMITGWEASAGEMVSEEKASIQLKLANTSSALQEAKNIIHVQEMLKSSLQKEKSVLDACATLADTLSPKNGLIAECIRTIIDQLTMQINNVIGQIWTYPLEVLPCEDDTDDSAPADLKYRFPLSIHHGQNVTEDIAKGSSAQRDVVDFAFSLCVYMYLDLDGWPLYLDELAPTMDEMHRTRIMQLVKLLIESHRNSQMFMISHYISGHGAFTQSEVCLLNDKNIINKPLRYNEHVLIK